MLLLEKTSVMNFENAIRGARNPLNSWERMDSFYNDAGEYILGENDLSLAARLARAGTDHRKFLRQVFVSVDITGPLYWWKEYDTYKVGTVANSTSTMHKLHSKKIVLDDFSHDQLTDTSLAQMKLFIDYLESIRKKYVAEKKKEDWYDLIQLLPASYNQLRTCSMNYENIISMYHARKTHKLSEWHIFCGWVEALPYAEQLILIYDK